MFTAPGLLLNRTSPAPLTLKREVVALLRGPMPGPSEYLSSNAFLRLGNWYNANLKTLPTVQDAQMNAFGSQQSGTFTADLIGRLPTPQYDDPEPRLTHRVYVAAGTGNAYVYHAISQPNYTVQLGDFFEIDVQVDPLSSALTTYAGSVELDFSDGSAARSLAITDQFGYGTIAFNATATAAVGNWVTRRFDLNAAVGKTINQVDLVNEDDAAGDYSITHYKNLKITNGAGKTRLVIWASGPLSVNGIAYSARNTQSTVTVADALKFETFTPVGTTQYTYWKNSTAAGRSIIAADVLEYEVFIPATSADATADGSIDLDFSDGTFGRSFSLVDQFGAHLCFHNSSVNGGTGKWIRRRISLTPAIGKIITFINLVSESDTAGQHIAYYRNIMITDGNGFIRQAIYLGGNPTLNVVNYQNLNFNSSVTVVNAPRLPGSAEEWLTAIKSQSVDLDLITRVTRTDGSQTDFINERRGVVKSISRKRDAITLNVVDIDHVAMKTMFPIKIFKTADFPNLHITHVSNPVPQGVGLGDKIPCTFIDNVTRTYAVCEVFNGIAPQVLTVYRGNTPRKGRIVDPAEYTTGTTTVAGTTYLTLTFTRDQLDFSNALYIIEADVMAPGSRLASDEVARLLQQIGLTIEPVTFAAAAVYNQSVKANVDAWYSGKQVFIDSILAPLLQVARGWLSHTVSGAYALTIDGPRTPNKLLWDESDQMQVDERSEPEITQKMTLRYRPGLDNKDDKTNQYAGNLSRTMTGMNGEKVILNEMIRDHETADRLLDFLVKKEQRASIHATFYGTVLRPGELVAINSPQVLDGWRSLAASSVSRVPDGCQVVGEEYSESDYAYTPGTLPTDATNAYLPDYSYTAPLAPTSPAINLNVTSIDDSGKAFATVGVSAIPPTLNWKTLYARITNNVTGEITAEQALRLIVTYRTTFGRLQPNTAHTLAVWARNSVGTDGLIATLAFTTVAYTGAPPTPTTPTVTQMVGTTVEVNTTVPTYPHHARIEWRRYNVTLASYSTPSGETSSRLIDTSGLSYGNGGYQYSCRFIDLSGNIGSWSANSTGMVLTQQIDDTHIIIGGVNTASIATAAVTTTKITNANVAYGKIKTSNSTSTYTVLPGNTIDLPVAGAAIGVQVTSITPDMFPMYASLGLFGQAFRVKNIDSVSRNVTITYNILEL